MTCPGRSSRFRNRGQLVGTGDVGRVRGPMSEMPRRRVKHV